MPKNALKMRLLRYQDLKAESQQILREIDRLADPRGVQIDGMPRGSAGGDAMTGIVAKRHSMTNVTTASVDNLTFMKGAYNGDMVVIKGKMTWVGSSSMEVCVDTYVETLRGERTRINNAHFMMVALDENDKPMRVPGLLLQTEDEHLAWAHGEERRRIRNQRKADKLDGI